MRNIECGVVSVNIVNGYGLFVFVVFEWNNVILNFFGFENVDVEVYIWLKGVVGEVVDVFNIYFDIISLGEVVDVYVRLKVGVSVVEVVKLYFR